MTDPRTEEPMPSGSPVRNRLRAVAAEYGSAAAPDASEAPPLGGHLLAIGVFTAAVATAATLGRNRLPEKYSLGDLALGGVAVHKLARIIAKESVASPLRAPFTHYIRPVGSSELEEEPREGKRRTFGELITCPFCLAPWLSAAYIAGLATAPRLTRALGAIFSSVALSDGLQHVSARLSTD